MVRAFEQQGALDRDEEIDGRVAIHDSDHVEVKLDCRLGTGSKSRYRIETYFFVPHSLGLNSNSYSRHDFYNDVQTYIRFKTPHIPLALLADPNKPESPLAQIRRALEQLQPAPRRKDLISELSYEMRMYGCVARAQLRNRCEAIGERIRGLAHDDHRHQILVGDIAALTHKFTNDTTGLLSNWRELRAAILDVSTPRATREMYLHVDEYLSLTVEQKLTSLIHEIDSCQLLNGPNPSQMSNARGRLRELIISEREYRAGAKYQTGSYANGNGEDFVYRRSMLKKLVTSVLWLEVDKQREGRTVADMAAAFAAGAAMLFAVLATIFATQMWMINTSAFVAAAVVTYMLKDRMKDWLKRYFSERINRVLPDYSVIIRDPLTGEDIGRSRETFAHVSPRRVPAQVRRLRHEQSRSDVELQGKQEVVLRYDKEIRLTNSSIVERMHLKDYDVNDITRFALWQLMIRADDPKYTMALYDPEDDCVERRAFRRVYHINIVMVFHAGKHTETTMRHLRVVFDKQKIRRLEHVSG